MSQQSFGTIKRSVYHGWVPQTSEIRKQFVRDLMEKTGKRRDQGHLPAVAEFSENLSDDQRGLFESSLRQVGQYYAEWADPHSIVTSFDDFLTLLDGIVEAAPQFYKANIRGVTIGEPIGVPLYLIVDLISNTSAAYTLFTQPSFNAALKTLLDSWGSWLKTPDSSNTLADQWFSDAGLVVLESDLSRLTFDETYKLDVAPPQRYNSWDSFFTREFKDPSVRPIVTDPNTPFLYNACECTVLRTTTNVQLHDTFWLKNQKYSLYDILGGDSMNSLASGYASRLAGCSAFQGFLSPQDYHRWHSPIKGTILSSEVFDGGYYAVLLDDGAPEYDPDLEPGDPHGALVRSQPWLSVSATRAVYIIEPIEVDSPIELIAFVAIGMAEVSTCQITVPEGVVDVGGEIGMFHFGGSSHAVFVKPKAGCELIFQDFYNTPIRPGQHRWINSVIGQFRATTTSA